MSFELVLWMFRNGVKEVGDGFVMKAKFGRRVMI